MFREIVSFELRYHLKQALFWLSALIFFLLTFGAVTTDVVQIGGAVGNVNRNAPFVIVQIMAVMSLIGVFVTTAFVASAVLRDFDHRTEALFFATPMKKRDYLLGRFTGAFAAALAIFVPVALAIVVGSLMPWLEPERVGPFHGAAYLFAFAAFVAPNIFLMSALFFGLATATRSLMYTYAGLVGLFVAYAIAGTILGDIENETLGALLDPFGFAAFATATRYWTTAERNTQVLALEGPFLLNRLIWTGAGVLALLATYARFSFTRLDRPSRRRRRGAVEAAEAMEIAAPTAAGVLGRAVRQDFSTAAGWKQYLHQTRGEIGRVLRSLPFAIILALGILNVAGSAVGMDQLFGTPVHPVTHLMLQVIQGAFLLFAIIILTLYSGEVVWRDRSLHTGDVLDALPVRTWVVWASKLTALAVIVFAVLLVGMLTAMGIQLLRGYTNLEPGLYVRAMLGEIGVSFLLIAVLALAAQVLTNNRFAGYGIMVLYFIGVPVLDALDLQHNLYRYGFTPAAPYSDMNGYGHFVQPMVWFYAYWGFAAVALGVLIHLFWVRGRDTAFRVRLRLARARLGRPARAALALSLAGFVGTGAFIFYNTNILNEYVPDDVQRDRRADYEKQYKQYEGLAQPRITAVYAEVDIYPERRDVDIRGRYTLRNKTASPVETVHFTIPPALTTAVLDVPGATLEHDDSVRGYRIYRLGSPLAPGQELVLGFDLAVDSRGFVNHGANTDIVENGTFLINVAYFPRIGYQRQAELQDPNERRRRGLPPVQRMPKLEDPAGRESNYISAEADWIDFETVVSTAADQIALAPGYLQREWTENGRRYFHYEMDSPILALFGYLSARYAVERDRWNDVDIEVYHHPGHAYNVRRMIDAVKASLDYLTANFGPYQHRQVRIVEFPRYARFAQSLPNTIPFSESIGFIARLDDPEDIDYVFYVTAHEVAHQWWAHQVIGGNAQGATVLSETMAQYSALMIMEKEYGPEHMRRFLKYELDAYLQGRGGERIEELPLLRVENQPYIHYRKGSLVMYALRDYFGEQPLNTAIAGFLDRTRYQGPPYPSSLEFLDALRAAAPAERAGVLEDLFETITLFENRARAATWERRPDGRYLVRLDVESRKYRADGQGVEREVPVGDWIDVAVFGERTAGAPEEGSVLLMEKRRITAAETVLELIVDEQPRRAGIDPFNKLIDRNPGNNVVAVGAGAG